MVECNLAKVEVASSNLVSRSLKAEAFASAFLISESISLYAVLVRSDGQTVTQN